VRISAPKSFVIATPTPLSERKAAFRRPLLRGRPEVAGVSSPGHAFKWTSREPRRAPYLSKSYQENDMDRMIEAVCATAANGDDAFSLGT
jgi:hypothetical protein